MFFLAEGILTKACSNSIFLKVYSFMSKLLSVVFFIVPMAIIIMISFDLVKNVIAGNYDQIKKNNNIIIKRLLYCVLLFLVPTITNIFISIVNGAISNVLDDYQSCEDNVDNIEYFEEKEKAQQELIQRKFLENNAVTNFKTYTEKIKVKEKKYNDDGSGSSSSSGASIVGAKYDLTDAQIKRIAALCVHEQGNVEAGVKAEATLVANRFEFVGSGSTGDDLYNFLYLSKNSSWWAADSRSASSSTSKQQDWVRDVLVNGNRNLPLYIDEHDYLGDISSVTNDGSSFRIYNRSGYQKDKTIIKNKMGSTYTFYEFPCSSCDPFGYTAESKKRFN